MESKERKPLNALAEQMAENIVQAYVEHDRKDYEKSACYFANVFKHLFPKLTKDRIMKAARAYANALRNHDAIEEGRYTKYEKFNHKQWNNVKHNLLEMCNALDLPKDYAEETVEFFRHHGIGSLQFAMHMLSADRIFTNSIIRNDELSLILGGLYLACVGCHDMHTDYGIRLGKKLIATYYEIILENMK